MQGTKLQRWVETDRWADWKDGMELTQTQMPRVGLSRACPPWASLCLILQLDSHPIRLLRSHTQLCLVHAGGSGVGGTVQHCRAQRGPPVLAGLPAPGHECLMPASPL